MTRAVLLGTNAWPFIIRYWLENLKSWQHKVERVYIAVDNTTKPEYLIYLRKRVEGNGKVVLLENCQGWPASYVDAFKASTEDLILIMHDDCFINDPGMLDTYFEMAAQGKVMTPLWGCYSPKEAVEEMLRNLAPGVFPLKLKEKVGGAGGWEGYAFILFMVFISRENMNKTTLNFNGWDNPNYENDHMAGDTGFVFEMDLLKQGVEIQPIPLFEGYMPMVGPYMHLGGMGTSLPFSVDENKTYGPNWSKEATTIKLNWLDKFLAINDYDDIKSYYDKARAWSLKTRALL
jgi:hypothetical protein